MELIAVLSDARSEILDQATDALERSHLGHYQASGPEELRRRLEALLPCRRMPLFARSILLSGGSWDP